MLTVDTEGDDWLWPAKRHPDERSFETLFLLSQKPLLGAILKLDELTALSFRKA